MGKLTEKLGLALVFSIVVWLGATVFFMLFGSAVLYRTLAKMVLCSAFCFLKPELLPFYMPVMLVYGGLTKRGSRRLSLALWGRLSVCFSTLFSLWNHSLIFPALSTAR